MNRISDFALRLSNLFNNEFISILFVGRVISVINCKSGYDRISFSAVDFCLGSIGEQMNFKNSFFGKSMNKNRRPRENISDDEFLVSEKHLNEFQCVLNDYKQIPIQSVRSFQ